MPSVYIPGKNKHVILKFYVENWNKYNLSSQNENILDKYLYTKQRLLTLIHI